MTPMERNIAAHELAHDELAKRPDLSTVDLSHVLAAKGPHCLGGMEPEYAEAIHAERELARLRELPRRSVQLAPEDRAMLDYERAHPKRTPEKFREVNRRFGKPWPFFLGKIEMLLENGADAEYADVAARLAATPAAEIYNPE